MRHSTRIICAASIAVLTATSASAFAQTQPVVSAPTQAQAQPVTTADLAKALVDGKPWNWVVPDGKSGKMTFMPGGKAKFSGPMTMNVSWKIKGQEFCIAMGLMLGTKCLTATAAKGGYQTFEKGKPGFLFTR
jgi:hypothetical protein